MTKLLDLFSGAGGAAVGYYRAGFDVVGVDIKPQPNYPFELIQSDVFALDESFLDEFDIIHASPPCQAHSKASAQWRNKGVDYPDLICATREYLREHPHIIENVPGAPLIKPLTLCGTMFGLRVIRHRLFEIDNVDAWVYPPCDCQHNGHVYDGDYCNVTGWGAICRPPGRTKEWRQQKSDEYFAGIKEKYGAGSGMAQYLDWCDAMGIDWMNKHHTLTKNKYDLTQAIPPAYTQHIGKLLLEGL